MTRLVMLVSLVVPGVLAAQQPQAPARTAAAIDSGTVVLETRLGGDSGQATMVRLRRGATYRLATRPALAEVTVRFAASGDSAPAPLALTPAPSNDSSGSWRAFTMVSGHAGRYLVELTNPGIGMTSIRISMVRRAPGDTLPTSMRRELVFSESVGGGPSYVMLDSGVVYRVIVNDDAFISPRQAYRSPPFRFASAQVGPRGAPYVPSFTGEYRIESASASGVSSVQIYREEVDQLAAACVVNSRGPGCLGSAPGRKYGVLLAMIAAPIAAYLLLVD